MAMKPRTFRRVILIGSLAGIVLALAFGYFVVRPWQNQRQIKSMRTEGLAAYEEGDFPTATAQLGRYINNVDDPDAELLLKFARSRLKWEANDGGHIRAAIGAYREYLRRNPGDTEAARELLPLMNLVGMSVEAKTLAEDLRNTHGDQSYEVARGYLLALAGVDASEGDIETVLEEIYNNEASTFVDVDRYFMFILRNDELHEEAQRQLVFELLAEREARYPGRVLEKLVRFRLEAEGENREEITKELTDIIGLDPETGEWDADAPALPEESIDFLSQAFDNLRHHDLSTATLLRYALQTNNVMSATWAARRLYWAQDDETLQALEINTENGEPNPDVLGYQYLSAVRVEDADRAAKLAEEIDSVVLDSRANAWRKIIEGEKAYRDDNYVDARIAIQAAMDIYSSEPTFRLLQGDIQINTGRVKDAVELWLQANQYANGDTSDPFNRQNKGWVTPMVRIINAYAAQNRLAEAFSYMDQLQLINGADPVASSTLMLSYSTLAQLNALPRRYAMGFIERWEANKGNIDDQAARASIAHRVAPIYLSVGQREEARELLLEAMASTSENPARLSELIQLDSLYALGVADELQIDSDAINAATPRGALQIANRIAQNPSNSNVDAGLRVIEEGLADAAGEDRYNWEIARVRFLDGIAAQRAGPFGNQLANNDLAEDALLRASSTWDELLKAYPDNISLMYEAADSFAYRQSIEKVEALIAEIATVTSTTGKTPSSRLRLARAYAFVGPPNSRTKLNRDRALEIVRSVVASEPNNVTARTMLAGLLQMGVSPGINAGDPDYFEPNRQGAIDEYVALSRQLDGRNAQGYLLEAADVAFELNDKVQFVALLQEFTNRFSEDLDSLPFVAERYENFGMLREAEELYRQILDETRSLNALLAVADLVLKQGRARESLSLLDQIAQVEELVQPQLAQLADLYARAGSMEKAQSVLADATGYGLTPFEAKLVYARFARLHLTPDDQLDALNDAVEIEPANSFAWTLLVQRLVELERFEEAQEAYGRAAQFVDPDETLQRLGILTRGMPQTARELLAMPGFENDPVLREAIERVDAYQTLAPETPVQERAQMLIAMLNEFGRLEAVQSYAVGQLSQLDVNPALIAREADEALKRIPSNTALMRITGESYVRLNQPNEALRVVGLWRANASAPSIVADAITAQAMLQQGRAQAAADLLEPLVPGAISSPDAMGNLGVLNAYSFARLELGEDPAETSARLYPLIAGNAEIRNRVWLGLATSGLIEHELGAEWIEQAQALGFDAELSTDQERLVYANAWVTLAEANGAWERAYAQRAIELLAPMLSSPDSATVRALVVCARAYAVQARSAGEGGDGSADYVQAAQLMKQATEARTEDLGLLVNGAAYATLAGDYALADELYERALAFDLGEGQAFAKAVILNNLAMNALRAGRIESQGAQLLRYAEQATQIAAEVASFWGTRGWIELGLDRLADAERSFKRATSLASEDPEGWVGLAVVYQRQGEQRAAELDEAIARINELHAEQVLSGELMRELREADLDVRLGNAP